MEEILILKWSAEQSGLRVFTNVPVMFKEGEEKTTDGIITWEDLEDMVIMKLCQNELSHLKVEIERKHTEFK